MYMVFSWKKYLPPIYLAAEASTLVVDTMASSVIDPLVLS